jgi:hypothetical protein
MDPRRPWPDSSVPSDRFYDDFDLVFNYLKKDSVIRFIIIIPLHLTDLRRSDVIFYSARIKPPVVPGKTKYGLFLNF